MNDVTRILSAIEQATRTPPPSCCRWSTTSCASSRPQKLAQEKPGQTLQATALVHEAYLRLVGRGPGAAPGTAAATSSPPRPRPCAASSSSSARRKAEPQARRRPARAWTSTPTTLPRPTAGRRPARPRRGAGPAGRDVDPAQAELVKLRYFAGLTSPRRPRSWASPPATAERHWAFARAWLSPQLAGDEATNRG